MRRTARLRAAQLDCEAGQRLATPQYVGLQRVTPLHEQHVHADGRRRCCRRADGTIGAAQRHTGMFGVALTPGQTGFTLPVPNASKWPRGLACKGSNQLSCAIARDPEQAMAQASTADLIRRPRASGA